MDLAAIWFFLWGLLWAVYFATDGFDLGVGMLVPFVGKNDTERRIMLNTVGPVWDGNEVWLIAAGGVTFAAFPKVYAVMFSALYLPLLLLLFALIIRGVAFEFRYQVGSPSWRRAWDVLICVSSFVAALLLGVAFANIFSGIPIDGDGIFHGTILTLLTPYGLLGGVFFVLLFLLHGALWLETHTEGEVRARSASTARGIWFLVFLVALLFVVTSYFWTGLFDNYLASPALFLVPALAVACLIGVKAAMGANRFWTGWFLSALAIVCCTFFGIIGLFPNLLPSSLAPAFSLSTANGASSPLTLKIMLVVALIFVPIVLIYQSWAYNLFKERSREDNLVY